MFMITERSGFALLLVLWVVGLISLLISGIIVGVRQYIQETSNIVGRANTEALADAGIMLIKLSVARSLTGNNQADGTETAQAPVICAMPEGALAILSLQRDEDKISLNTDSMEMIEAILSFAGASLEEAERLAIKIVEFRTVHNTNKQPEQAASTSIAPKHGPFETVMELDQIEGMRSALFRAVLPYVTVSPHAATLDIANILRVAQSSPRPLTRPLVDLVQTLRNNRILVHAEVLGTDGSFFVREATLSLSAAEDPISIMEWRQDFPRYKESLADAADMRANHTMLYSRCDGN